VYSEVDFTVKAALRTPAFWFLVLSSIAFQMTMSPLFVHLVPHLVTAGISTKVASLTVMFITLCSVLGRAGFGWLSDILDKKWLLVCNFALQAIGLFAFSQVRTVFHLALFILAYAPGYGGGIALRPAIVGGYFGRKNFGTIYGILLGSGLFGGISGPIIAGYAYDVFGDFRLVFMMFALLSLITAMLLVFMQRPRPKLQS
jgi:MFS family permease